MTRQFHAHLCVKSSQLKPAVAFHNYKSNNKEENDWRAVDGTMEPK